MKQYLSSLKLTGTRQLHGLGLTFSDGCLWSVSLVTTDVLRKINESPNVAVSFSAPLTFTEKHSKRDLTQNNFITSKPENSIDWNVLKK